MTGQKSWSETEIDDELSRLGQLTADLAGETGTDRRAVVALGSVSDRLHQSRVPVVVVGEVSRGKSSLINALLGRKLLPDDFRASTTTWSQISHGPAFTATAYIESESGEVVTADIRMEADLAIYLSAAGESARAFAALHGKAARVLSVDIALPAPILESGLELLDTPGVGGLRAAHRAAALAALAQADAVIFVTTPGEPLSKSELIFFAEAAERVTACVFVQTHHDQTPDGESALQQSLATLRDPGAWAAALGSGDRAARLAARFASLPGASVSATNAILAAGVRDDDRRRRLIRDSNIAVLTEILDRDIVANGHRLQQQNIRALMESLHSRIAEKAREHILIYEGDAAGVAVIDALDARVAKWLRSNGDYWRRQFDADCDALIDKLAGRARERADELEQEYHGKFKSLSRAQIESAIERLLDAPGSLLLDLLGVVDRGLDDATRRVRVLLEAEGLGGGLGQADRTNAVIKRLSKPVAVDGKHHTDSEDIRGGIIGGMAGIGAASALQGLGLLAVGAAVPIFWPFLIGAGVFVGLNRMRRNEEKSIDSANRVLEKVLTEIRTTAYQRARQALLEAKDRVTQDISAGLEDLGDQVREDRQRLADAAGMTASQRTQRIAEAQADIDRADDLAAQLKAVPVS